MLRILIGRSESMSDILQALETSSRGWNGGTPTGAMLRATRAFLTSAADDPALLQEAAASLSRQEPGAATWIAVASGTVVEGGASAELSGPALFDLLRSWLSRLPEVTKQTDLLSEPTPEQGELLNLFKYLCQSVVTHLARLPVQRAALGQDLALLERLGELQGYSHGAVWVREALLKSSGPLILLHPPSGIGLRLNYSNVSNCFHLFSLLQTAVGTRIPGGRPPDETIAWVARGKSNDVVSDEAWWHYGSALSNKPNIAASIWGEGVVREIPLVDGMPVVLAWPPILNGRSWDGNFLGPHLDAMPADLVIERELTAEESQSLLEKLRIAKKKWWQPFG
jgi:hypothetical protein